MRLPILMCHFAMLCAAFMGQESDRDLLMFLAAYLRSDVARFFLFHTSSNWGVYRPEVHVEELLRLPFPLPEDTHNPKRGQAIVREIADAVTRATDEASRNLADREGIVRCTQESVCKLIEEYFDIDEIERMLIADTAQIIIPSVQPSRGKTRCADHQAKQRRAPCLIHKSAL